MKHRAYLLAGLAGAALVAAGRAEINVPGDGSDGVFAPTANVEIDLSEAATGVWDANNAARAGRGIYDPEQWAIVFKFALVTVPPDVTVTFKNHPSRAPVVWLVQGDVVINGLIRLDGENGDADASLTHINKEGGPGGFRGGLGTYNGSLEGAGKNGNGPSDTYYATSYGNPNILPLIGGPGTSFPMWYAPSRRSGGGGAILIASRTRMVLGGRISARGGDDGAYNSNVGEHRGYGGAIKLICDEASGAGTLDVSNGGRLRIEANGQQFTHPSLADYFVTPPGPTPVIWPPADAPKARILSVGGQLTPTEPLARLNGQPDLTLQTTNQVDVVIETRSFPIEGSVALRVIPKYANAWWVGATFTEGSFDRALWTARTSINPAYTTLQVRAAAP